MNFRQLINVKAAAGNVPSIDSIEGAQLDINAVINNIVSLVFQLAIVILFALIVYGGFTYLTSGGDSDKVKKAQNILTNAVLGFGVVSASFLIVKLIGASIGIEVNIF